MKTTLDLSNETKTEEERLLCVRRRIWQGEEVSAREVTDAGMVALDYLCKLSSRIEKERNPELVAWLQQTRRSLRAQLKEYWGDALDKRRDIRALPTNGNGHKRNGFENGAALSRWHTG